MVRLNKPPLIHLTAEDAIKHNSELPIIIMFAFNVNVCLLCGIVGHWNFQQLFLWAKSKVAQLDFTGSAPQTSTRQKNSQGAI